jgi:pilus assembly protein CpaE
MSGRGTKRETALTALLVAEDRELAQAVTAAVAGTHEFEILSDLRGYPQEQTLEIRLRQIQPDVVLMDLASDFDAAEKLIRYISKVDPPVRVVGLHRINNPEALIRSLRAGASEFLSAPFDAGAQREAAVRIRRLREPENKSPQEFGKLVVWSSAKPGSGASTLATQCAFSLKRLTGKRVLLVDLDLFSGSIAFSMKLSPTYSVLDALERSDQLEPGLWSALTVNAYGIDVLAAPDSSSGEDVEYSRVHEVFEYARMRYEWIVVDLPAIFHRLSLFALSEADQAYLVSTAELPSLHLARRAVGMLLQLGYGKERFQMIVNRLNKRAEISAADMQKIFSCPVYASLPNDYHSLHKVVTRAEALPAESELGRAIEQIAARLGGLVRGERKDQAGVIESKPVLLEG